MSALAKNIWLDRLLCAFFPRRCKYCGALLVPSETVCATCAATLPRVDLPVCTLCGCQKADCACKQKKHKYDAICAPFYYEHTIVQAVHRFKFDGKDFLASAFAEDMAFAVQRDFPTVDFDTVTFVPFTKKQEKTRAFNPSALLAHALAERMQVPCAPLLVKLYETETQHYLKSSARVGNVFGVFDVDETFSVTGKTILLVDDIKTTGATLHECAKMLKLAGAQAVYVCTFAVTKPRSK